MVRLSKKKTCPLERCRFRSGKKPCLFYFEYANGKATCANAKELNEYQRNLKIRGEVGEQ